MPRIENLQSDLSDRLLLLANTFRRAREGYQIFDHQAAKTFQALLVESYEDALVLEAMAAGHIPPPSAEIVPFTPVVVVNNDPKGGAA